MPGGGHGHINLGHARRSRVGSDCRDGRLSLHGGQRQWNRTDVERHALMAGGSQGRLILHCARCPAAHAFMCEKGGNRCRTVSWNASTEASGTIASVPMPAPCPASDCGMARRLQPSPRTSLDGLTPQKYHQRSRKDRDLNRPNTQTQPPRGAGQRFAYAHHRFGTPRGWMLLRLQSGRSMRTGRTFRCQRKLGRLSQRRAEGFALWRRGHSGAMN